MILLIIASTPFFIVKADTDVILYQLPGATHSQMMGYVIKPPNNRLIVLDGGTYGDSEQLRELINKLGGKVDSWFITHPHFDHIEALVDILNNPQNIVVSQIYASLLDYELALKYEPTYSDNVQLFNSTIEQHSSIFTELQKGDLFQFDGGISLEVMRVPDSTITANFINNSSCVFRVEAENISMLFLGDLGEEGGNELLETYGNDLRSDIVQMSHHGQDGVTREVYEAISPEICLWPTPIWLWDNKLQNQPAGSGPWGTLEVREWMEEMDTISIVSYKGLSEIRLTCINEIKEKFR